MVVSLVVTRIVNDVLDRHAERHRGTLALSLNTSFEVMSLDDWVRNIGWSRKVCLRRRLDDRRKLRLRFSTEV